MILFSVSNESAQIPLEVRLTTTKEEIYMAYRLRYSMLGKEVEANTMNDGLTEKDKYDDNCDHLIVIRTDTQEIVGTYRLLPGKKALKGIGFFSQNQFDLTEFSPWFTETVELGRSCVKKEFRTGRVINLLWQGIQRYITENNVRYLIGCVSLPAGAAKDIIEIYTYLKTNHVFGGITIRPKEDYQLNTLHELDLSANQNELFKNLPPLLKSYLRLGAYICGEPAYDPLFRTFNFFMILDRNHIAKKSRDNYLKAI